MGEGSGLGLGVWGQCVYEKSQNSKTLEMIKSQDVNGKRLRQEDWQRPLVKTAACGGAS